MRFDIITIFPEAFTSYFNASILKRAQKKGLIKVGLHNLRKWAQGKHKQVDDRPYGGGPGMVLKIEPVYKAVQFLKRKAQNAKRKTKVILFAARGKKFDQKMAQRLAKYDQLIFISGRYEGVDNRVARYIADEEISIGDYILSGGELPAMILVDAISRLIKGVLGNIESIEESRLIGGYPVYTKPEKFSPDKNKTWRVPKVLLSGDHKKIEKWRQSHD